MKVTIIGTVAFDSVETPYGRRQDVLGGSASFASLSAAFFAPVNLISVVGTDFPRKYISMFENKGIDTSGLERKKGKTFRWKASYLDDMNCARTLRTDLNVFSDFRPSIPRSVRPGDNLFLANIDPDLQSWIFKRVNAGGMVVCDTMNLWITHKKKALLSLLRNVDLFLLNDAEARQLSGEDNLLHAARYAASRGPKMVVIKKGEHGALFFRKGVLSSVVPAYLLNTIKDPTGAGDTFAGGMIGYLSRKGRVTEADLRRALVYGSILASFTVERFSVDGLIKISKKDVEERYRHFRSLVQV